MGNNINDLKKFIGNNLPLKPNNISKIKDELKSVETKNSDEIIDDNSKSLIEKNSPSEILGRTQVKNMSNNKAVNDNFEHDMKFIEKNYKAVCLANNMFNKFMDNGYSYNDSTLLTHQFVKEIS